MAHQVKHSFKKLLKLSSMPPLIIGVLMQVFQQLTGGNAIMFYAPILFQTVGIKSNGSLLSAVITGLVNVLSTFVSIFLVDRLGRRKLLLQRCIQMFICQVRLDARKKKHTSQTYNLIVHDYNNIVFQYVARLNNDLWYYC